MKKYILFLFSFTPALCAYGMGEDPTYTAQLKFSNTNSSYDIDVKLHGIDDIVSLKQGTEILKPITVQASDKNIFITDIIVYEKSSNKRVYPENNFVVRQINWNIGENINCKEAGTVAPFLVTFNNMTVNALAESESISKGGSIRKAVREGLVLEEKSGGYRLRKSGYFFYDYDDKDAHKIVSVTNDASQDITIVLNDDKNVSLIIPHHQLGSLKLTHKFVLRTIKINKQSVGNEIIEAIQTKINLMMPHHACDILTIDDDLLHEIDVPAIGRYVTFENKSHIGLTLVINRANDGDERERIMYLGPVLSKQATKRGLEEIAKKYQTRKTAEQAASSSAAPASPRGERAGMISPRRERGGRERTGSNEMYERRGKRSSTVDLPLYKDRYLQDITINGHYFDHDSRLAVFLNQEIDAGRKIVIDDTFLEKYSLTSDVTISIT